MRVSAEVEIREAQPGREPSLTGVLLQEGAPAEYRKEVFLPGAIEWPSSGIGISTVHLGPVETRAHVSRAKDGRLNIRARANQAIQDAYESGRRFLSVEFTALQDGRTAGGIRQIARAFVAQAALVETPEYSQAVAEVRSAEDLREFCLWL